LPALHPDRTSDAVPDATPAPARVPAPLPAPDRHGAAPATAIPPALAQRSMIPAISANREVAPPPPSPSVPSSWEAIAASQASFDQLTRGLLDGLGSAQPADAPREAR
jgi:hypothetical protein